MGGREWTFLVLWLVLPPVSFFLISHAWKPFFAARYVLYASFPLYILVAGGAASMATSRKRTVTACLLVASMAFQLCLALSGPFRPSWATAARMLGAMSVQPVDIVSNFHDAGTNLEYFLGRHGLNGVVHWNDPEILDSIIEANKKPSDTWFVYFRGGPAEWLQFAGLLKSTEVPVEIYEFPGRGQSLRFIRIRGTAEPSREAFHTRRSQYRDAGYSASKTPSTPRSRS